MRDSNTRLPEIGEFVRSVGRLVECQDVTPPPPQTVHDFIFEVSEAKVQAFANGKELTDLCTLNDFYGEGTCVESAIRDAKKYAVEYGPGVEIRVTKVTHRIRKRPTLEVNFYDKKFPDFETLKSGSRRDLPDDVEEVVWSSLSDGNR